ncbi:MAG: beta-lactamase family protein [Lachnospiraceae bacterium]|nr:beta-lactamase family protein [Lachnospiraceae bacterium]
MKDFSADSFPFPLHSFHIWQGGKLLAENYYAPYDPRQLHRMFSVTKSLTALAIGGLVAEEKLSLSDPILRFFPEYAPESPHPYLAEMTIRHLLAMQTCYKETTYKADPSSNWVRSFFTTPPDHRPGRVFKYDTSAAHTLAALVKKLSGESVLGFLRPLFLNAIGFSGDACILKDPFGDELGGSGLMARPGDLLLTAKLLLSIYKGSFREDYLPLFRKSSRRQDDAFWERFAAFVKEALSFQSPTIQQGKTLDELQGYGWQFWRIRDGFAMYGMGGQYAAVYPGADLIIVSTADAQAAQGGTQILLDAMHDTYLALGGRPAPEGFASFSAEAPSRPFPKELLGNYEFLKNDRGFESCEIKETEVVLICQKKRFSFSLENENLSYGQSKDPLYGETLFSRWSVSKDGALFLYAQILSECLGNIRMLLRGGDGRLTIALSHVEESSFFAFSGFLEGVRTGCLRAEEIQGS